MMYYVNDNACATLEDAEEVQSLYQAAGVAADILTEADYFCQKHILMGYNSKTNSIYTTD